MIDIALVSVALRTREIRLRKAMGHVTRQFLMNSVVLAVDGFPWFWPSPASSSGWVIGSAPTRIQSGLAPPDRSAPVRIIAVLLRPHPSPGRLRFPRKLLWNAAAPLSVRTRLACPAIGTDAPGRAAAYLCQIRATS
jgi:hypothetical protein